MKMTLEWTQKESKTNKYSTLTKKMMMMNMNQQSRKTSPSKFTTTHFKRQRRLKTSLLTKLLRSMIQRILILRKMNMTCIFLSQEAHNQVLTTQINKTRNQKPLLELIIPPIILILKLTRMWKNCLNTFLDSNLSILNLRLVLSLSFLTTSQQLERSMPF